MKKHSKSIALLGASILALSAAGFGFSKWSSDLNLNGNVTAKNSWDVAITEATVSRTSTGTTVNAEERVTQPTVEVEVYDVYADYCTDFNPNWDHYRVHIDDTNPHTIQINRDQLADYDFRCFVSGNVPVGYKFYESGKTGSNIQYMINFNELGESMDFKGVYTEDTDDATNDGKLIGVAIGEHLASPRKNPWGIKIMYDDVKKTLDNAADIIDYPAVIDEAGHSAVFGDVNLGLPGAWSEYTVTVANNGTVNANMKDWKIALETDSELIHLSTADLSGDTVLAPGETCTFTFVAQVEDTDNPVLNEEGSIHVHLIHEQDAVEPAPEPTHVH